MAHPKNTDFIDQLNEEFADAEGSASEKEGSKSESGDFAPDGSADFAKLLEESFKKPARKISVGDKIRGQILVLGQEDVYVSLGDRSGVQADGVISRRDLNHEDGSCPYKVGDAIELYVTQEVRLSRKPTDKNIAEDLEDAFDMMLPVQGRVVEVCKGGVRVNIKGKIAFCPISQLDSKHIETAEEYVGRSFEFRITQFSEGGKNIVVSRRKILEEERELNVGSFLEENKDGDVVKGKVARLEKFGAFVELAPGVDGLVHISEIAWSRIGDPSELLQVGQEVSVKLLKRETVGDRVKISLSIKQALPKGEGLKRGPAAGGTAEAGAAAVPNDPWSKFSVGQILTGKVNRKELYGVFVQLEPGITGLLHKSRTFEHPDFQYEKLKVNDSVSVQIAEIKREERRISLDVPRDPNEDDWKKHTQVETKSLGTLADKFAAALAKKK
jgi:small subunit ribosomal protein S1